MYGYPLVSVAAIENIASDIQEKGTRFIYAAIWPFPYLILLDGRRSSMIFYTVFIAVRAAFCWFFTHLAHLSRY
jgi:hypothetical protein